MRTHRRQALAALGAALAGIGGNDQLATDSRGATARADGRDPSRTNDQPGAATATAQWSAPARRASPPVDRDRGVVYVGHDGGVSAYDIDDGRRQWTADVGDRHLRLDEGTLYVCDDRGGTSTLRALDVADGSVRWTESIPSRLLSTPRLHDGRLFLETKSNADGVERPIEDDRTDPAPAGDEIGRIQAHSADDGTLLWAAEREGQLRVDATARGTVVVRAVPSDWIQDEERIYALDGATGDVRWKRVEDAPTDTRAPGTLVYCSHPSDQLVRARDPVDGTVRWERTGDVGPAARAAHDGTAVFTTQGGVLAIEEATGRVRWRHDVGETPQPVDAAVDADRGIAYAAVRDAPRYAVGAPSAPESTTVIAHDLESGTRKWARTCPYYTSSRLALGADTVCVYSWAGQPFDAGLAAFDASTGAIQFRSTIDGTRLATPPQVDDTTLVVATDTDADDSLRLTALSTDRSRTERAIDADRGSPTDRTLPDADGASVRFVEVVTVDHAGTIGVAAALDASSAPATITLTSTDGSRSTALSETALTEPVAGARLQTASVEQTTLDFEPAVCTVSADGDSLSVEFDGSRSR